MSNLPDFSRWSLKNIVYLLGRLIGIETSPYISEVTKQIIDSNQELRDEFIRGAENGQRARMDREGRV